MGTSQQLERAILEAEERYRAANPKSRAVYEAACRALPGGNVRSHLYFPPFPLALERGEGSRLWDVDQHCYGDFLCEYAAGFFGHSDPRIVAALKSALDRGVVMGGPGPTEAAFGQLLCDRMPSLERVRFCNSGTEANLFALAAARVYTGRDRILVFNGAYHGSCFRFAKGGSALNIPLSFVVAPYNDADQARTIIARHATELAAIIVEPILGAGGYIAGDADFLRALREESTRHGIVLIFDEVVSSRMALGGMQSILGIVPDMTTLGKHVGGGCSFGAFGGRADIMRRFDPREPDALYHAGTFNNNRLTMTAGYTAMSEVFTEEAVNGLRERGNRLRATLAERIAKHGVAAHITGFGSVMNVHFTPRPVRRYEDVPADATPKRLWHLDMLHAGYYCPPRGGILLSLPMTEDQLQGITRAFENFLADRGKLLELANTDQTQERAGVPAA